MDRYDVFSRCHPVVQLTYFVLAVAFCMVFLHPLVLALGFFGGMAYLFRLKGILSFKTVFGAVLTALCLASFNVLFNHRGETVLAYFRSGNPLTLESILYGLALGFSFGCLLLWLSCFSLCFTSDRLMCLVGVFPPLSVLFTVTLRFIPLYIKRIKRASADRYAFGMKEKGIKGGIRVLETVSGQALEEAIEMADIMRGRGLGLKGRTAFSPFVFTLHDGVILGIVVLMSACVFCFAPRVEYLPRFNFDRLDMVGVCGVFVFMLLPVIMDLYGDLKWRCLK